MCNRAQKSLAEPSLHVHLGGMSTPTAAALPDLYSELAVASWETILHRTMMMMSGTCSLDEYQRMVTEKAEAFQGSAIALLLGGGEQAILAPFHSAAKANAQRLRGMNEG